MVNEPDLTYRNSIYNFTSLLDTKAGLHPSQWIKGNMKMEEPEHVW